jgi:hypothetical protein
MNVFLRQVDTTLKADGLLLKCQGVGESHFAHSQPFRTWMSLSVKNTTNSTLESKIHDKSFLKTGFKPKITTNFHWR